MGGKGSRGLSNCDVPLGFSNTCARCKLDGHNKNAPTTYGPVMDDDTTLARVKLVVLGAVKFVKRTVRWYDMPWPVTTRSTARPREDAC